jgi:hypothetical protein
MNRRELADRLAELPPGRYTCLFVRGRAGHRWLADQPPIPRTMQLRSSDGEEDVFVFDVADGSPPTGATYELAEGVVVAGVEVIPE